MLSWVMLAQASAETWYVSSSLGDDSYSGTLEEPDGHGDGPKKTLAAAKDLLNEAAPGDEVLLRRGDVWNESLTIGSAVGTADDPIVFGAYGSGDMPILDYQEDGNTILIRGDDNDATTHLVIEDLHFTTSASPGSRPAAMQIIETYNPYEPSHITLRGLRIEGLRFGLVLQADDITVEDCEIRDNYGIDPESGHTQGIYASGDNIVVRNNIIDNNGRDDSWFDWNTYLTNGDGYVFEGNVSSGSVGGVKLREVTNAVVRDNEIFDMTLVAISVGGDDDGGTSNVLIERNLVYDTVDGITIKDQSGEGVDGVVNLTIQNNVLVDNKLDGPMGGGYAGWITVGNDPVQNLVIRNNLLYGVRDKAVLFVNIAEPDGLEVTNNIFGRADDSDYVLELDDPKVLDHMVLSHNLYAEDTGPLALIGSDEYLDLAALNAAHPDFVADEIQADPGFVDAAGGDFGLLTDSPAVDAGLEVDLYEDFDGVTRPADGDEDGTALWDIGPFELSHATHGGDTGDTGGSSGGDDTGDTASPGAGDDTGADPGGDPSGDPTDDDGSVVVDGGCGCSASGGAGAAWLLPLVAAGFLRRRRGS